MLAKLLADRNWLLADGAMATTLFARGLALHAPPERWLLDAPDMIRAVHRDFVAAGSDIVLTNTFGANCRRLARVGLADRSHDLNRIAVDLARAAAAETIRPVVIAGSVGPTGERIGNAGALSADSAVAVFAEQLEALRDAGADIAWIETMYSAIECRAAVTAAIAVGIPYVVTATFGVSGSTIDGTNPAEFARALAASPTPPAAIGANCGEGPDQIVGAVTAMARAAPGTALVAKANKGLPEVTDGKLTYAFGAPAMGGYARRARMAGARIIGGCCGTTPDDIAAMRAALDAAS